MFKRFLVVLSCLVLVFPVFAQDLSDEEQAYLDEILSAIDATLSMDTYRMEGGQILTQYIEVAGTEMTMELIQEMEGDFITLEDGQNAYMVLDQALAQDISGTEIEFNMTMEILIIEDGMYIQISDVDPSEMQAMYPDEWIFLDSSSAGTYPGLEMLNAEQFTQMADAQQLTAPLIDLEVIASTLEVLDDEEVNGVLTNVYRMTASPELLFSEEYMDTIAGLLNFEAMGLDAGQMEFEVDEDGLVQYTFYIGQNDGLLYRQESILDLTMTIDGTPLGVPGDFIIDQESIGEFDFLDFGEDIELPDPSN